VTPAQKRAQRIAQICSAISTGRARPRRAETVAATAEKLYGICLECGRSHDAASRQRLLRPMLDMDPDEIRDAWPCFYPATVAGKQMLSRDRAALRS